MTALALTICETHQPIDAVAATRDRICLETGGEIRAFGVREVHRGYLAPTDETHVLTLDDEVWTLDAMGRIVALGKERLRRVNNGTVDERPVKLPGPADTMAASPQGGALLAVCGVAIDSDIERARAVEIDADGVARALDLESFGSIEAQPFSRGHAVLVCDTGCVWYVTGNGIGHLSHEAEDAHSLRAAPSSYSLALVRSDPEGFEHIALGRAERAAWLWRDLPMPTEIAIIDFAWRGAHPELVLSATRDGRGCLMVVALDGTILTETVLPRPWVTDNIAVAPDGQQVYAICGNLVAVWNVAFQ